MNVFLGSFGVPFVCNGNRSRRDVASRRSKYDSEGNTHLIDF